MPQANRILVVDDHREFGDFVQRVAAKAGFEVSVATSGAEFKDVYHAVQPSIVCLDIVMPTEDGIELMNWLAAERSRAAIYIITGHSPSFARAAVAIGRSRGLNIVGVLQKPVSLDALRNILKAARDGTDMVAAD
ncbi:response regulator [Ferrovibrio terrae]|uniref:response regulator n=1 Tax=Ferrovibrio terrae TaxID=2594003 RepID=UPI003137F989